MDKRVSESSFHDNCRGSCGRVAVVDAPLTTATNVVQCEPCDIQFCFNCTGSWFEAHRPASCREMARFGGMLPGAGAGGEGDGANDAMLSMLAIYANTIPCPRCGTRVVNAGGCFHRTCGTDAHDARMRLKGGARVHVKFQSSKTINRNKRL